MTNEIKEAKLEAHLNAVNKHKELLEKLHLNGNQHLQVTLPAYPYRAL